MENPKITLKGKTYTAPPPKVKLWREVTKFKDKFGDKEQGDEDHPDWTASTGTNWFTAVDGAPPGPLTVTISPVDGSSGVAADANLTWTFANAIQATDVTAANFILLKADDGSLVAGVLSTDSEHKVVTFNPASNLAPGADYIMVCTQGVRDICGQNLAVASIGSFTTAD